MATEVGNAQECIQDVEAWLERRWVDDELVTWQRSQQARRRSFALRCQAVATTLISVLLTLVLIGMIGNASIGLFWRLMLCGLAAAAAYASSRLWVGRRKIVQRVDGAETAKQKPDVTEEALRSGLRALQHVALRADGEEARAILAYVAQLELQVQELRG
jgi:hypothetical protein